MGRAGSIPETRLGMASTLLLEDQDFALFVLNVGDGDALVLRLPAESAAGDVPVPSYAVIDSFAGEKTIALLETLNAGASDIAIRFVCATHPHFDHIKDLKDVLVHFKGKIAEFWDSGFRYTSATYRSLLAEIVSQAPGIRLVRPTSGYEYFQSGALLTVLSPSIALRNRYDTYGIDLNNASIVLKITYPVRPPGDEYPKGEDQKPPGALPSRTIILGGDAQTDAWGQVIQEFPHLDKDPKNWVRQIGGGTGSQPLACDFFKVSHHASKRGVNLELIERLGDRSGGAGPSNGPRWLVASCASGPDSSYGFPHTVTQELLREVRDPQAQKGGTHPADDELGIHYTSQTLDPGPGVAGSVAYVVHQDGSADLFRFGDGISDMVDPAKARRVKP
jgi:beta-lactamase superfamily II metal-dependent hydrolase